jgi:hypothetical protein
MNTAVYLLATSHDQLVVAVSINIHIVLNQFSYFICDSDEGKELCLKPHLSVESR